MKSSKKKFFIIGIIVLLAWVFIEAYIYSIAVEGEKNYTTDLLKEAQGHYDEISNIRNLPENIGTIYVKKGDKFVKFDMTSLVHELLKKYQNKGTYYSVNPPMQTPKNYKYSIDKEKKRIHYFYDGIGIDMDASFYLQRIKSVWFKFFLVTFLFTVFISALLFFIRFMAKRASNYEYLSNILFEKSPNIIILTTGKKLIRANEAFFKFFTEYNSIDEFRAEHECICDFFCESEHNDTFRSTKKSWLQDVLSMKEPIIKICYADKEYYFSVHVKEIYENNGKLIMVTFNDITEIYNIRHKFEELSAHDALTGIYNRRYFNIVFPRELNRAKRTHESFCFAIMDVDHFKFYNDNYGHDAGDEALQKVTAKITELTQRANESFFRLGGEEFGFISSADTKEEVFEHLQNICQEVQNLKNEHLYNEQYGVVTISVGVCYLVDAISGEVKQIYKSADNALYKAKETGRNKVVLFENC